MAPLPEGFLRGFRIVVAHDADLGIGYHYDLPWRIPEDLRMFKDITMATAEGRQPAVIMGKTTWDSLPRRPLPERTNVVLSRTSREIPEACAYSSLEKAIKANCCSPYCGNVFVIGGGSVYSQALAHPGLVGLYVTEVQGSHKCNVFMPEYRDKGFVVESASEWQTSSSGETFRFLRYGKA